MPPGLIYEAAVRTPLVRIELDAGAPIRELYLKLEVLQPIGSFKIRGAYNVVRQLSKDELKDGVWTVSAGNAAQGVALAARKVGAPCSVMVMDTAPATKVDAIRRLGASIVRASYDECWKTVIEHGSDRMKGHFVHPFDDDRFIAGNGTIGLEILEDLPDVDAIVAPLGGGGLLAGIAAAVGGARPETRIFAAEPETAAPLAASLAAGRAVFFDGWTASFVDGAGGKSVLETMWPLLQRLTGSLVVSLADSRSRHEARRRTRPRDRGGRRRMRRGGSGKRPRGNAARSWPSCRAETSTWRRLRRWSRASRRSSQTASVDEAGPRVNRWAGPHES